MSTDGRQPRHVFLIDGSGFIFRAFHALPPMNRPDGTPVNAVFGFTSMLLKTIQETDADYVAVIFDTARKTFRNDLYAAYKAHRPPPPEELVVQFPLVRDAVRAMSVACVEQDGFEADDLIATYARHAVEAGAEVTIVSSDKDLMQLVGPKVKMYDAMRDRVIGDAEVREKFGVGPERVIDVQALTGDSVDNVPGVRGIGEGPAARLIQEFGSLEGLLTAVEDPDAVKAMATEKSTEIEQRIYGIVGHEFKLGSTKQLCEVLVGELKLPLPKDKKTGNYSANAAALEELARQGHEIAKLILECRFYAKLNSSYADLLAEKAADARISYKLVTLRADVEVPEPLSSFRVPQPDPDRLIAYLREQSFRSLAQRVENRTGRAGTSAPAAPAPAAVVPAEKPHLPAKIETVNYELVQDEDRLAQWIAEAYEAGLVAVDTETTSLNPMSAELCGISLAVEDGRACYIPLGHREGAAQGAFDLGAESVPAKGNGTLTQIALPRAIELLKPLLEDPGVLKIGQNIKFDMEIFYRYGVKVAPVDDTMIISYVLEGGAHGHGMDELALLHLGHTTIKYKEVTGSGKAQITFDLVPLERARDYAAEDADVTRRLYGALKPRLVRDRMVSVYETLERPLIPVLAEMEETGIRVDAALLKSLSDDFARRLADLEEEIHRIVGHPFNIGSPKQLGEVLFDEMGLNGGKKGKTGAYATGADILETLAAEGHELPARVLDWRQLAKLKSTYTDALVNEINPATGRVHTCYSQAIASTGRLSSNDPNLQNIPVRTDEGRKIRRAFVPDEGAQLVSADYSQIELRLLAHVAEIPALVEAFHAGADIHAITASQVFGIPVEGMDPMVRRKAKAINFGIIYGISAFGLARQLAIPRGEAQAYIDAYFARYPGIRDYMEHTKEQARRDGYVTTLYGRRCHVTGIRDKNPNVRNFAERAAINAPIQGGAADIIKRAMIRLPGAIERAGLKARMLLQVHDELIFEVPEAEVDEMTALAKSVMESVAHLSVPLVVDTGVGRNWDEAH